MLPAFVIYLLITISRQRIQEVENFLFQFSGALTTTHSSSLCSCAAAAGMAQDKTTNEHFALQPGDSQPIYAQIAHKKAERFRKRDASLLVWTEMVMASTFLLHLVVVYGYRSENMPQFLFFQPAETKFQIAQHNLNISLSVLRCRPSWKREGYTGVKHRESTRWKTACLPGENKRLTPGGMS